VTTFNARIEWKSRLGADSLDLVDDLMTALDQWHPAIGASLRGFTEAIITLEAENIRQAISTAGVIASDTAHTAGGEVLAIEVMPTVEFDTRDNLVPLPDMVSVTEAAEMLGITVQAVRQRLESGSLTGVKVGATWVIPAAPLNELVDA